MEWTYERGLRSLSVRGELPEGSACAAQGEPDEQRGGGSQSEPAQEPLQLRGGCLDFGDHPGDGCGSKEFELCPAVAFRRDAVTEAFGRGGRPVFGGDGGDQVRVAMHETDDAEVVGHVQKRQFGAIGEQVVPRHVLAKGRLQTDQDGAEAVLDRGDRQMGAAGLAVERGQVAGREGRHAVELSDDRLGAHGRSGHLEGKCCGSLRRRQHGADPHGHLASRVQIHPWNTALEVLQLGQRLLKVGRHGAKLACGRRVLLAGRGTVLASIPRIRHAVSPAWPAGCPCRYRARL